MEETVIVIMLKDAETGFLEKELGAYSISENGELIFNIYAEGEEKKVVMRLTCERELQDWEYDAVYDYYDTETVGALVDSIEEEDGHYDPVWVVTFPFAEEQDVMEQKLTDILDAHKEELLSVYEAIKDKEDDYRGE
ncbi:MAG: hypothetical protein MR278_08305 [Bacteroidales bacterium]|nr:DUF6762 family protein [Anaerotignum sp.]MCI5679961.1 hypothetical protein [Bacteroidales bacterium]MDY3926412.1 DUF6762 family protein [Anaerotignum sp.]